MRTQQVVVHQRLERGLSLVELMITISIIAMVASGTGVFALKKYREAKVTTAATNARAIRNAVQHFHVVGHLGCPDVEQLRELGILDKASTKEDPWGGRFSITCPDGDVMVASRGPDRTEWSKDDIFIPDLSDAVDPFAQGTITGDGWSLQEDDLPQGLSLEEWLAEANSKEERTAEAAKSPRPPEEPNP